MAVVARPLVPTELTAVTTPPAHAVEDLVEAFVQADTGWKQQYVLARYPGLYQRQAEALLERQIDQARQAGDTTKFASLRVQRGMLAGCRQAGVTTIQALLPSPQVYVPTTPLNELLLATAQVMRSGQRDAAVVGLSEARHLVTQDARG